VRLNPSHSPRLLTSVLVKAGYPPRALTGVIPELPISSLGLAPGDQLIVNQKPGSAVTQGATLTPQPAVPANPHAAVISPHAPLPPPSSNPRPAATAPSAQSSGPDFVRTEGGYLVHRVRAMVTTPSREHVLRALILQIVPDDNSCMFASVALIFEQNMQKAPVIRQSTSPRLCQRYALSPHDPA
jgi:ubiquitin thioesterase OTU1